VRRDLDDLDDAEDVGGAKPEHVLHPYHRRQCVDVGPQPVEHMAAPVGALVHERETELLEAHGVQEQQIRTRVLGKVARRLRHELVRERDSLVVDLVGAGDEGDVGHAVARGGGQHCRDGTTEAALDVVKVHVGARMALPAVGPGV
jgi:hypothetical protein